MTRPIIGSCTVFCCAIFLSTTPGVPGQTTLTVPEAGLATTPLDLCDGPSLSNLTLYRYKDQTKQKSCRCSEVDFCVPKCCAPGFYLSKGFCSKQENSSDFQVPLYRKDTFLRDEHVRADSGFVVGFMDCDFYPLIPSKDPVQDSFRVQEDGRLWTQVEGYLAKGRFCVDILIDEGFSALICYTEESDADTLFRQLFIAGMIISIPFLLATFLAYALLPELTVQMKALMFYVLNLMLGYVFMVVIHLGDEIPGCALIGHLCLFFLLASFFWMNVICIDTWCTTCNFKSLSGSKKATSRRFFIYCNYAWLIPVFHFIAVVILDTKAPENAWYKPSIGHGQCFLGAGYPELLYFYGWIGTLIAIDVGLFVATAVKLWILSKEACSTRSEKAKRKYLLYLKLLFAMGLNWSLEIISWATNWSTGEVPPYIWYLSDLCNALYGVFIFFIFVFRTSVWNVLKNRFNLCLGKTDRGYYLTAVQDFIQSEEEHMNQPTNNTT